MSAEMRREWQKMFTSSDPCGRATWQAIRDDAEEFINHLQRKRYQRDVY